MTDEQTQDMRIKQLEESLLEQESAMRELRSEVEALGDALVITAATLERTTPGSFLVRLREAAEAQRELGNERAARTIETLIASAEQER